MSGDDYKSVGRNALAGANAWHVATSEPNCGSPSQAAKLRPRVPARKCQARAGSASRHITIPARLRRVTGYSAFAGQNPTSGGILGAAELKGRGPH
jgi:hypothetical protein